MNKRSIKLVILIAVFALVAAACGSSTEETTTTAADTGGDTTTTTADAGGGDTTTTADAGGGDTTTTADAGGGEFRIAIVAPSATNDLAFTQSIVDAANVLKDAGIVSEIAVTDGTFVVDDAAVAIRDYASDGYDLVIAHGSQYGGSLSEIAPDFPETSFAWGTSADTFGLPNVYAYEAASDQGGEVMGIMAAALSESDVVGIVGPIEVGDAKLYVDGFKAGVLIQNPSADVRVNYIDSFSDVALASEAATSLIGAGADVLSGTAQMVVGAVGVAKTEGVLWFGTQANQTSLAPEIVVASQVYRWDVIFEEIIKNVKDGKLGGEMYVITFANEGLVIEYNDGYDLSADVRKLADDAIERLKSEG